MSVSASPESVYVDVDATNEEVEDEVEDEGTFPRVGITNSIRSSSQIQHPIAEMIPAATLESNQQKQQIRRPQQLQVSSQSAFTLVWRSPTHLRRKSFIRPHKAAAGRRLAPALHSKAGHRICSRSHEECVLTWLACCDRPQDYSFLVTMGANGVLGLFVDIKALTTNVHFKVD